ncbi:uncharacterized protein LOC110269230 [Arachis ipaensis]|uniref:uncharacterized protein LOC110269230 n=1 Tax=Arachis ipaensis TaxID=130454 RepID=UPI000A2B7059|nr:uncharacterized protein LOC110269230 [Arachis ipaensis]
MANVHPHEPLKHYIAASENTIGCMLAQDDENGHEQAVYYLSQVLTDIETRYSLIEKLCLPLYKACTKLKCYMVAKPVKIIAQTDLVKYMLSSPMLRGRLGKWMLALTEFDLQYVPAKAVKGQVIADFLVDHSNNLNDQGANIIDVHVDYWKLYFDGSKHKDGAGMGILIISPEEILSQFLFELKYSCSNNVAEYEALILGLEILIRKRALEVQILGNSQLVLKQLLKEFKCNNQKLQKYLAKAWKLLTSFQNVSLVHIPRIHTKIANELAQIASRYKIGPETIRKLAKVRQILVPMDEREAFYLDEWENNDWRKPIAEYLKNPSIQLDRKIKLKAMNFVLMADELYKKGIDGRYALGKVRRGRLLVFQSEMVESPVEIQQIRQSELKNETLVAPIQMDFVAWSVQEQVEKMLIQITGMDFLRTNGGIDSVSKSSFESEGAARMSWMGYSLSSEELSLED